MNKAIIDTDLFSEIAKRVDQTVLANAKTYRSVHYRDTVSAITSMEVVRGYQKKQETKRLGSFLVAISSEEVISLDRNSASLAGAIRGELERMGRSIVSPIR